MLSDFKIPIIVQILIVWWAVEVILIHSYKTETNSILPSQPLIHLLFTYSWHALEF